MTDTLDPRALHASRAKYAPHLDFNTKAAIYALFHGRGVARKVLADAFGVHRLTVAHIVDDEPTHYATVKAMARQVGLADMDAAYVTNEHIEAINSTLAGKPAKASPSPKSDTRADPTAKSHEGTHRLTARNARGHICVNLYVDIVWLGVDSIRKPGKMPGWYWTRRSSLEFHDMAGRVGLTSKGVFDYLAKAVEEGELK